MAHPLEAPHIGLTADNMLTSSNAERFQDTAVRFHDLTAMNREQLVRYCEMAFLKQTDLEFLPPAFWEHFESPLSPPSIFANIYNTVGRILFEYPYSDTSSAKDWGKIPVKEGFREDFRAALIQIAEDCLGRAMPSEQDVLLAQSVITTAIKISIGDRPFQVMTEHYPDGDNRVFFRKALEMARDSRYAPHLDENTQKNLVWLDFDFSTGLK